MTKYLLTFTLIVTSLAAQAQTFTTQQDGPWNDPATWDQGSIPNAGNSTAIVVNNFVNIPSGFSVTIDGTTVSASGFLTVNGGGTLTVAAVTDALVVDGILVADQGSSISGSTATSMTVNGLYQHNFVSTQGIIPLATWSSTSTIEIIGYTGFLTATAAGNWGQNFNRFVWNCPNQTDIVDLTGRLVSVAANLEVQNTGSSMGSGVLTLSSNENPTINIGGNVEISGESRVYFSGPAIAPGAVVNVAGDFIFTSSSIETRLTSSGVCNVNIGGNFYMDAPGGSLNCASANSGNGILNITGNFDLINGTIGQTGGTGAFGFINFVNSASEHVFNSTGTLTNKLAYTVADGNTLRVLGESQLSGTASSSLTLAGTANLILESTAPNGAIQIGIGALVDGGNIRVQTRTYSASSTVTLGGFSEQFFGAGQTAVATTVIENAAGVSIASGILVTVNGSIVLQTGDLTCANGSLTANGNVILNGGNLNLTTNGTARTLTFGPASDVNLNGGQINVTSGTTNATLTINGTLSGFNFINFSGINSLLTIGGSGALGVDFPLSGPTSLKTLTINRPGGTVVFNEQLTLGNAGVTNGLVLTNGNLRMNNSLIIPRSLSLAAGTILYFEDQTLNLQMAISGTGGALSSNSNSILNVTGTGNLGTILFDAGGNTLGTFTLNRSSANTVTLNSPLTVTSTFTLQGGTFTNTSGLSFASGANVTRTLTNTNSGTFTGAIPGGGPYNLIYTGSGTGIMNTGVLASGSLNNITTTFPGTVSLNGAVSAAGNLAINSGTFDCNTNTLAIGGNITIGSIFTASTGTVTLGGNLTNNGTFNRNSGTMIFAGTTSILGTNANATQFNNVTITGTLTAPTTTFTVFGNFTNNGTFTAGSGTTNFFGPTVNAIGGTSTTTFNNIFVDNNTTSPAAEVTGTINLQGVLSLGVGIVFDADGSAGTGVFTILSTGDNPTVDGSIADLTTNGASVTGNLTVQRYMSGEGRIYRYISSPVSGASVASWQDDFTITGPFSNPSVSDPICGFNVVSGSPSLYYYDETPAAGGGSDPGWITYPASGNSAGSPLVVGRGYSPYIRECATPTIVDVTGPANQGAINVNLRFTNHGEPTMDGYNLVGNPYPSAINWQAAGWVRSATNISPVIAIRDNGAGGGFIYLDYTDGSANDYIASGQAFWVRASADNQTLGFRENTKVSASTTFYRSIADDAIAITLTRGAITDKAVLKLNPNASASLDIFDGPKLNNAMFDFATLSEESIAMAINAVDKIACGTDVPLSFKFYTNPNGTYTMNFAPTGLFANYHITLVDTYTGTSVNVSQQPVYQYTVDSNAGSRASNRFKMIFEQQNPVVLDLAVSDASICAEEVAQITISGTQAGVLYMAQLGSTVVSDTILGDGFDKVLTVPASKLGADNTLTINANGLCGVHTLSKVSVIQKEGLVSASTLNGSACQEGSVKLKVASPIEGVTYRWYASETSASVIGEGIELTTPVLTQSHTYAVSAVNRLGCEGSRALATAEVIEFDDAFIITVDDGILQSNFEAGNQWYKNGEMIIGAVEQELAVTESGVYKVEVTVQGCMTSAEKEFIVLGAEENANAIVKIYPNPVSDELTVQFKNPQDVKTTVLFDNMGKSLESKGTHQIREGKVTFTMNSYPAGVYVVKVQGSTYLSTFKVLKK